MHNALLEEMERTIDRIATVGEFNELLKRFARDKAAETSRWGEMTRLVHFMLGGSSPHIDRLAALTELLVLALDIADDLQDRDNVEKSWMQCPPELSLNAVMGLLMGAVGELGRLQAEYPDERFPLPGEIGQLVLNAVNGQYRDLTNDIATEQDYIAVVQMKSCMLLKLAYYMGYGALKPDPAVAERMDLLAGYLGVVAQLANDLRDVLRYDVKNDLLHKKRTLTVLFLLGDDEDSYPIVRQYYAGELDREQFLAHKQETIDYIRDSGCIEYTEVIQSLFLQKAKETLDELPGDPEWKAKFSELALGKPADEPEAEAVDNSRP